jgi:3-deoxy-D-manno-octulosonate 8-phosphate phosphatase (KDO 8-P phosphatase)
MPRARRGLPSRARLRQLRLLILDVDGVLTDGGLYYGPHGEEWKRFHVQDGLALSRAATVGFPVAVVSSRSSAAVARRCAELGIAEVHQGVPDKLAVYDRLRVQHGVDDAAVACMGDDLADLGVLKRAGLAIAPADAAPDVRRAAAWISRAGGGHGAVREVLEAILRARGEW